MGEPAARARRLGGYRHEVLAGEHELSTDEPESKGGEGTAPSATDLLAAALAACTATTMEMYGDRKGWDLDDLTVSVETEGLLSKNDRIYEVVIAFPDALDDDQRARLLKIAAKCPVHKAIATSIPVNISTSGEGSG